MLVGCRDRAPLLENCGADQLHHTRVRRRATELKGDAVFDKSSELDELFAYCAEQMTERKKEEVCQAERGAVVRGEALVGKWPGHSPCNRCACVLVGDGEAGAVPTFPSQVGHART